MTPEFGTCNDIAHTTIEPGPDDSPEPILAMPGFLGPFEPPLAWQQAAKQLHRFVLRQGKVEEEAEKPG